LSILFSVEIDDKEVLIFFLWEEDCIFDKEWEISNIYHS
jgi:hypothetical protein